MLSRKPLKDEVYDALHHDVLAGRVAPGKWLRQEEIASRLGVSMTPVREALDLLVSAGLAERVPYRGVRVVRPSSADILDAYAMRLLLEGVAARAAASNATAEEISGLRQILAESTKLLNLEDMPRERASSRAIHSAIVAASGNSLLHRAYLNVLNSWPDWLLYEHLFRQPELLAESMRQEHEEHARIIDSMADRDPDAAMQRAIEHVTHRGRELEIYLGVPHDQLADREHQTLSVFAGYQQQVSIFR